MEITKKTTLAEILNKPGAKEILEKHNLPCLTCPFAEIEMENLRLDDICKMYNMDIVKILKELNKINKK
jgi:hypothetical protein